MIAHCLTKTWNHVLEPTWKSVNDEAKHFFFSKGDGVVKNPVAAKEYGDIAADMLKQLKYIYIFITSFAYFYDFVKHSSVCCHSDSTVFG